MSMFTTLHCVAQDLARLLLCAVAMPARATLQSCLHVIVEPSDQDLRHEVNDSTISLTWEKLFVPRKAVLPTRMEQLDMLARWILVGLRRMRC
jgi:hypothetical protein